MLVVIFISILGVVLYAKSFMNEKEKIRNLKYKIVDATTDYFGDGRYQIMQFDPNGDYYVQDMKSSFQLFVGNIKAYKKIGNEVYFIHKEGNTILDYKNNNLKQYIDTTKYIASEKDFYEDMLISVNKRIFGDKWILLKNYNDFTPKEKEVFNKLKSKS
ncbi:hypothetical protein [Bacillus sp. AFS002410]|uniref:hypothetical protein n=1 Tax=Bacillus sp. AFS002410 TaxID=2033481 RepID=UPI001155BDD9|nr:hypothetical protein [Bacillus sp. AFS002410]